MIVEVLGLLLGTILFGICRLADSKSTNNVHIYEEPIERIDDETIRCSLHQWSSLTDEERKSIKTVELR